MNQKRVHTLRRLYVQLPGFSPEDPRSRSAWRGFKRAYNAVPRNRRAAYLASIAQQIDVMVRVAASQAEAKTEQTT